MIKFGWTMEEFNELPMSSFNALTREMTEEAKREEKTAKRGRAKMPRGRFRR